MNETHEQTPEQQRKAVQAIVDDDLMWIVSEGLTTNSGALSSPSGPLCAPEAIVPPIKKSTNSETHEKASVIASRFKTSLCATFEQKGKCKYSYHCMFAHGEREKRTVDDNIKDGIVDEVAVEQYRKKERFNQRQQSKNNSGSLAEPSQAGEKKLAPTPSKSTASAPPPPQYIAPMVQTDLAAQFGMQMMGYPNPYPTGMPTPYPLYSYFPQMMMPSPLPAMPAALATAPSTQEDAVVRTVDDTVRTAKSDLGAERIKPSSEPTVAATSETALPQPITTPPAGMLFYPPPPMMYMPGAGYVAPYPQQPYFIPVPMSGAFPQGYGMHPMFALPQIQPPATTPGPDKK